MHAHATEAVHAPASPPRSVRPHEPVGERARLGSGARRCAGSSIDRQPVAADAWRSGSPTPTRRATDRRRRCMAVPARWTSSRCSTPTPSTRTCSSCTAASSSRNQESDSTSTTTARRCSSFSTARHSSPSTDARRRSKARPARRRAWDTHTRFTTRPTRRCSG